MYNYQLETFIQVADAGSFSKAAELLYISPSAVIKQINLLENHLGIKLFARTHRGIALTSSGQSIYRDAKYIIEYSKESLIRAKTAANGESNIIRIGTSLMTPTQFLVALWPKIHTSCPELKFQLIPFENTPENAREILRNLGQNIDLVAGIYDKALVERRQCTCLDLAKVPLCCAMSVHHRLAKKERLSVEDLFGENFMMINRGWNSYVDTLRDDILELYPQINIIDFPFYDVSVFNQCENSNNLLMAVDAWENVHPLLKVVRVDWKYMTDFGLLFSPAPSEQVKRFIRAVAQAY